MTPTTIGLIQFLASAGMTVFLGAIIVSVATRLQRLQVLCINLYLAGYWKAEGVSAHEAMTLWTDLRDELGLPKGTATSLGVGDPHA